MCMCISRSFLATPPKGGKGECQLTSLILSMLSGEKEVYVVEQANVY